MSLVNRMLQDLSARAPASGNVMQGIRVPDALGRTRRGLGRVFALVGLAAVFTGGLWLVYGPKRHPAPEPRASLVEAAAPAVAPLAGVSRFSLDDSLSSVPAPREPARDAEPAPAPRAQAPKKDVPVATTRSADASGAEPEAVSDRRLAARQELAQGRPQRAVELLQRDAPSAADDPEYNGLLASAYQRVNRHEEASRIYGALVNVQPEEGHWWAGYGISRDALGDPGEARQAYNRALQSGTLDPRVIQYVSGRLEALKKGG